MEFTLRIEMGNEAMQTHRDIAFALRKLADKLDDEFGGKVAASGGGIMDENGNRVGSWEIGEWA